MPQTRLFLVVASAERCEGFRRPPQGSVTPTEMNTFTGSSAAGVLPTTVITWSVVSCQPIDWREVRPLHHGKTARKGVSRGTVEDCFTIKLIIKFNVKYRFQKHLSNDIKFNKGMCIFRTVKFIFRNKNPNFTYSLLRAGY